MKLCECYIERDDIDSATHAVRFAERAALADPEDPLPDEPVARGGTLDLPA